MKSKRTAYDSWISLLLLTSISHADEGSSGDAVSKQQSKNLLLISWFLFLVWKQCLSSFTGIPAYISGNTITRTGNTSQLIQAVADSAFTNCASYRLLCWMQHRSGDMMIVRMVRAIDDETDQELRMKKEKMCKLMHTLSIMGVSGTATSIMIMMSGLLPINIMFSQSLIESLCWCCWTLVDLGLAISISVDMLTFPGIWMVTAVMYDLDVQHLMAMIERLRSLVSSSGVTSSNSVATGITDATAAAELMTSIRRHYQRLVKQSQCVNQMLAPILYILTMYAIPVICLCLFISLFSDNIFFYATMPFVLISFTTFTCCLMAIAAHISHKSDALHASLCSAFANDCCLTGILQQKDRVTLVHMIEDLGSHHQSLALRTYVGDKYTMHMLTEYVIETCLDFCLLLTFDQYFQLH